MLFITRYDFSGGKWNEPVPFEDLHVAERALVPDLPEWRKMPYCRNGGMNLKAWDFIELEPATVHPSHVCRSCCKRMEANGIGIQFGDGASDGL